MQFRERSYSRQQLQANFRACPEPAYFSTGIRIVQESAAISANMTIRTNQSDFGTLPEYRSSQDESFRVVGLRERSRRT
jgi:hypothetical protein